ncbi:MAG TPA: signal peptidase I [Candidatus Acidoferrum sp.]|nr:signal peptidase I [Candidatus Acidoferrum sp.]
MSWRIKCVIAIALIPGTIIGLLIILRLLGLFHVFYIPYGSMAPAISQGDSIAVEGLTFLMRSPRRGDIVVFKTQDTPPLTPGAFYIKRVAGLPGDHLLISGGELFIDDKLVTLSNNEGEIVYDMPLSASSFLLQTNVTVPDDCYFLLGDNSTNSLDSRFVGSIARNDIKGLAVFCYWPPARIGAIK